MYAMFSVEKQINYTNYCYMLVNFFVWICLQNRLLSSAFGQIGSGVDVDGCRGV